MRRSALLKRCQGPSALPIALLVRRGDAAAKIVSQTFGKHLRSALGELQDAMLPHLKGGVSETEHANWLTRVRDLRSSSATAGYETVHEFAAALETVLEPEQCGAHRNAAIKLHLDGLLLAANPETSADEIQRLRESLHQLRTAMPLPGLRSKSVGLAPPFFRRTNKLDMADAEGICQLIQRDD